ncbi:MAG: trypsin-like peptidase domain-containing protein [Gammaproteobacteria bacterium]|nr:trypsin-like peptidase domain-containing protein [Gammaproteobacteria bacterium]
MRIRKLLPFLFQSITLGLAVAFVVVLLRPNLLEPRHAVVLSRQDAAPVQAQGAAEPSQYTSSGSTVQAPFSYARAVTRAAPAVVNIYTGTFIDRHGDPFFEDPLFQYFFGNPSSGLGPRLQTSLGSGIIVSHQGYVVTNYHVIARANLIRVALRDGRSAAATVVGSDPQTDLAVLKINLKHLPVIAFGDSKKLRVGDVVLAIGDPYGVGQTVTMGIVSALGRRSHLGFSPFENLIQTDAAINPGNSGGALINTYGDLVGINTAIVTRSGGAQGIGFAIPVDLVRQVLPQIIEHGRVIRGWLGIQAQNLTPGLAAAFGLNEARGALISGVLHNGPAAKAGLQPGDIITRINGAPVGDAAGALRTIAAQAPGSRVRLDVWRDGKPLRLQIVVGQRH